MAQFILLINTNVTRPPVSPVGLEYVGESLIESRVSVRILDLAFETDWRAALAREVRICDPLVVGLTVRNTDDSSFVTRNSFLPWISDVVAEVRRLTQAFVLIGGVGFSVMPEVTLGLIKADAGVAGDGEEVVPTLVRCLMNGKGISELPNLVFWHKRNVVCNHRANVDLKYLPVPRRRLFDNRRYEELGAIVGIETKRGCPQQCIFCADPVAKGSSVRVRPPLTVVQEFKDLLAQGVSWFHLCDSEFNLPISHAKDVCSAIVEAGLGDNLNWYCYCSPVPFDRELVILMKRAGCTGINFGVDSLCDEQLFRLGRSHSISDIQQLVRILNQEKINYMFDLLIGGPGETRETLRTTIGNVRKLNVPLSGIAAGVRVYPGTPLSRAIANGSIREGLYPEGESKPHEPLFYLSPHLGMDVLQQITDSVTGDSRFLFLASPAEERSYNYADDETLSQMIKAGARGAYWDIIRGRQEPSRNDSHLPKRKGQYR